MIHSCMHQRSFPSSIQRKRMVLGDPTTHIGMHERQQSTCEYIESNAHTVIELFNSSTLR